MNDRQIRVLHCLTDRGVGGAGVLLSYLLAAKKDPRITYAVALPQDSAMLPRLRAACRGVLFFPLPLDERSASLRNLPCFFRVIFKFKPHILHTHGAFSARLAGLFCPPFPYLLLTKHCVFAHRTPLARFFAHAAVATADAARDRLTAEGFPSARILTVGNAVPPLSFPSQDCRTACRTALRAVGKKLIVFLGRLSPDKDPAFLLSVAKKLADDDRFLFLYIGDGSLKNALAARAEMLGLASRVRFYGYTDTPALPLSLAFALLSCSPRSATRSLAIGEALSLGIPVLASDVGGTRELVHEGENGFLFPVGCADLCADRLTRMANDDALYAHLQRGAVRSVSEKDAACASASYEALYRALCRPRAKKGCNLRKMWYTIF